MQTYQFVLLKIEKFFVFPIDFQILVDSTLLYYAFFTNYCQFFPDQFFPRAIYCSWEEITGSILPKSKKSPGRTANIRN
jgi:hypothetical protein